MNGKQARIFLGLLAAGVVVAGVGYAVYRATRDETPVKTSTGEPRTLSAPSAPAASAAAPAASAAAPAPSAPAASAAAPAAAPAASAAETGGAS